MTTTPRRKTTRRDLPWFCALYGIIFALFAVAMTIASHTNKASLETLKTVSGTVELVTHFRSPRASPKLNIEVRSANEVHHLTQDDLSAAAPALLSLRVGDLITAMVKHDGLGRDLDWYWELKRGNATLLTIAETSQHVQGRNARGQRTASGAAVISVALLIFGAALRRHFGAWRDAT